MSVGIDWTLHVNAALLEFHRRRCDKLNEITAAAIFSGKNPYMYRATCGDDVDKIVAIALKAFVASSDETIFGNVVFEQLSIAACQGWKSATVGIDVEFQRDGVQHRVAVKSGPKVFNSSSRKKQIENFEKARRISRTNTTDRASTQFVVGYAYGRKSGENALFKEIAGQAYWSYISGGDETLYLQICELIGQESDRYIKQFDEAYHNAKQRLKQEFRKLYCLQDGLIDWDALVKAVSERKPVHKSTTRKRR